MKPDPTKIDRNQKKVARTETIAARMIALKIVEVSARDSEHAKRVLDALSYDEIVAMARELAASGHPEVADADPFLGLLVSAMQDAAIEYHATQLQIQITPEGRSSPSTLRIVVLPEDMQWRTPKSQPLGAREAKMNE